MFFGVFATILISLMLGGFWMYMYSHLHPNFGFMIVLYCLSGIIESSAEPFIAKNILNFDYSITAKTEFISVFMKTLMLFLLTKFKIFDELLNFGVA